MKNKNNNENQANETIVHMYNYNIQNDSKDRFLLFALNLK